MIVRQMEWQDLEKGLLETLENLSLVGSLSQIEQHIIYEEIKRNPLHLIFVAEEHGKIVGTLTLFIERKFIHRGGLVGHIEDVVVRSGWQGRGIGRKLVEHALDVAKQAGCYKVILDCNESNAPFYEKLGFRKYEVCMRYDTAEI